ncbi:MAG: phosphonate ABC transporter ATP-binding protein [Pseudomonadota bacterium]
MSIVSVQHLSKHFERNNAALDDVNFSVQSGEMIALIGASGSGKSTLLRHLSGLLESDSNALTSVDVCGETIQSGGKVSSQARHIRRKVGVVFQQFNLVPRLSVLTNVLLGNLGAMPYWLAALGFFTKPQKQLAMQALGRVGIKDKALSRGADLSGGQQQRAAIARALVQNAEVIAADEPIASLDPSAARRVMDVLKELNKNDGITVLVSLHQVEYALSYCARTIAMRDGRIVYDGDSNSLTPDFLAELYGDESEDLLLPSLTKPKNELARPAVWSNSFSSNQGTLSSGRESRLSETTLPA